jgi:hypothetical protein
MPPLVVILVVATAASMPAAQKPTIAPNQNHVVLAADDASALQKALDAHRRWVCTSCSAATKACFSAALGRPTVERIEPSAKTAAIGWNEPSTQRGSNRSVSFLPRLPDRKKEQSL